MYLIMSLKACCEPDGTYGIHVNSQERFGEKEKQYSYSICSYIALTGAQMTDTDSRHADGQSIRHRRRIMGEQDYIRNHCCRTNTLCCSSAGKKKFNLIFLCFLFFIHKCFCIPLVLFLLCSSQFSYPLLMIGSCQITWPLMWTCIAQTQNKNNDTVSIT